MVSACSDIYVELTLTRDDPLPAVSVTEPAAREMVYAPCFPLDQPPCGAAIAVVGRDLLGMPLAGLVLTSETREGCPPAGPKV